MSQKIHFFALMELGVVDDMGVDIVGRIEICWKSEGNTVKLALNSRKSCKSLFL